MPEKINVKSKPARKSSKLTATKKVAPKKVAAKKSVVPTKRAVNRKTTASQVKQHWKNSIGSTICWIAFALSCINAFIFYRTEDGYFALILANGFFIWLIFNGKSKQCPQCRAWWAMEYLDSRILNSWNQFENVAREDVTKNRRGDVISTTQRVEQVVVNKKHVELKKQCGVCGHISTSEFVS